MISRDVFLTFVGTSQAKPYFLRAFLEGILSELLSEVGVLDEVVMKKSRKNIAPQRDNALKYRARQQNLSIWNS